MGGGAPSSTRLRQYETVAIVVSDQSVTAVIQQALQADGFGVVACTSGAALLEAWDKLDADLVILGANLPDIDSAVLCHKLRETSDVPLIIITTREDEEPARQAFAAGADDFVRTPFFPNELIARVHAILHRSDAEAHDVRRVIAGPVEVDELLQLVRLDGKEIELSWIELRLLSYVVRNPNRVLTRDSILAHVWGPTYTGSHHLLRVAMSRLRKRLGLGERDDFRIETRGGVGYRVSIPSLMAPSRSRRKAGPTD